MDLAGGIRRIGSLSTTSHASGAGNSALSNYFGVDHRSPALGPAYTSHASFTWSGATRPSKSPPRTSFPPRPSEIPRFLPPITPPPRVLDSCPRPPSLPSHPPPRRHPPTNRPCSKPRMGRRQSLLAQQLSGYKRPDAGYLPVEEEEGEESREVR